MEQNSWFCSKNGMIILYWFGFYLLLAFLPGFRPDGGPT